MVPIKTLAPRGVLEGYMTRGRGGGGGGGLAYFFGVENLHPLYFLGSRDLAHIFLGLKKYVFFGVISFSRAGVTLQKCYLGERGEGGR